MGTIIDLSVGLSGFAAAGSVMVAVVLYLNTYIQRQAEHFWDLLFDCEQDFFAVYQEFDQRGAIETIRRIMGHPTFNHLLSECYSKRNQTPEEYKAFIQGVKPSVYIMVLDALYGGEEDSTLQRSFKRFNLTLEKIHPRFPHLYMYLKALHYQMQQQIRLVQYPDICRNLVVRTLEIINTEEALKTKDSFDSLKMSVHGVMFQVLTQSDYNKFANNLSDKLIELSELILPLYKLKPPFTLWRLARQERRVPLSWDGTYDEILFRFLESKKSLLAENYGKASKIIGEIRNIIQTVQKTPSSD